MNTAQQRDKSNDDETKCQCRTSSMSEEGITLSEIEDKLSSLEVEGTGSKKRTRDEFENKDVDEVNKSNAEDKAVQTED